MYHVDGEDVWGNVEDGEDIPRELEADPRYKLLDRLQREGLERASTKWVEEGRDGISRICGIPVKRGVWAGQPCKNPAGLKTVHEGYGRCFAHGGAKLKGRVEGAWMAAHAFGQQLDINPWDALLMAVRIAAGKVQYCEYVIGTAQSDLELEGRFERVGADDQGNGGILVHPDTGAPLGVGEYRDLSFWVSQSEVWHDRLAKTSKMAIDAGIAAWQVEKIEQEAQRMARVLNAVIEGLESKIDDATALEMRAIMRNELLRIDEEEGLNKQLESRTTDPDRAVVDSTGRWEDER